MSTFSRFDVPERGLIKSLFRRKIARPVSLSERNQVRSTISFLRDAFDLQAEDGRALPVSTLEWASTSFALGGKKLALVDVEQANAVSFLLAKSLLLERPIFCYIEFMIRAAEFYYSSERPGTALLIAKKANDRLRSYAKSSKSFPRISRPISPSNAAFESLKSGMVLAFVAGHEFGHLMQNENGALKELSDWIAVTYQNNEAEPGNFGGGQFTRFLKPESVQKFDEKGVFRGDIILGVKYRDRWDHLKTLQEGEAFSDLVGLLALTKVAIDENVDPDVAASSVMQFLEYTEMLMALKRLLPRLPVKSARTNVAHESTSLGFRRFMFVEALDAMRNRELPIPKEISDYWRGMSDDLFSEMSRSKGSGELYSVSNRAVHIARGALLVNSFGHMPEAPSEELIMQSYGPLAGNGFFLASCQKIPERWFRIDMHNSWVPKPEDEAVPVGYASAICDLGKIIWKKTGVEFAESEVKGKSGLSHSVMLELIRHSRTQVFQRRVIGTWPNSVMKSI